MRMKEALRGIRDSNKGLEEATNDLQRSVALMKEKNSSS